MEQNPDKCVLGVEDAVKDFIYKINNSKTFKSTDINEFFDNNEGKLTIISVGNSESIRSEIIRIEIKKELIDNKTIYIFHVNTIIIATARIDSQKLLNTLIEQTCEALSSHPNAHTYSKYIDDLKNCIS